MLSKESEIEDFCLAWTKRLDAAMGLSVKSKVLDLNFRATEPEITIDIVFPDKTEDSKLFRENYLPIVNKFLFELLEYFRNILRVYLQKYSSAMGYYLIK